MATSKPINFTVNLADLLKILEQIKIAERHVATGSVADADPRIISNLISDQTADNFAAVFKALELAGSINPFADTQAILDAFAAAEAALAVVVALQAGGAFPGNPALVAAQTAAALAATTAANLPVAAGLDISPNGSITILNQSPDIGLSPPFNGWMTMFGQFFDHGLDLIPKGGNGTVYIPLQPDDPLYVVGGPNFMAPTRSAAVSLPGVDGVLSTADDLWSDETTNLTTPFIDQNQTYTSNASHQALLREYKLVDGKPANTGHLLDGASGGIANWGEAKQQAREKLDIERCRSAAPSYRWRHHADPGRRQRRLGS